MLEHVESTADALDVAVRRNTQQHPQGQPVVYGPQSTERPQSQPQVFDMSQGDTTSASGFESLNGGSGGLSGLMQGVGLEELDSQVQGAQLQSEQVVSGVAGAVGAPDACPSGVTMHSGPGGPVGVGDQSIDGNSASGPAFLASQQSSQPAVGSGCSVVGMMPGVGGIPPPPPFPAPGMTGCLGPVPGLAGCHGGMPGMYPPPGFVGAGLQSPTQVLPSPSSHVLENIVVLMQQQMQHMQHQNAMILGLVQQMQQSQAVTQTAAAGPMA